MFKKKSTNCKQFNAISKTRVVFVSFIGSTFLLWITGVLANAKVEIICSRKSLNCYTMYRLGVIEKIISDTKVYEVCPDESLYCYTMHHLSTIKKLMPNRTVHEVCSDKSFYCSSMFYWSTLTSVVNPDNSDNIHTYRILLSLAGFGALFLCYCIISIYKFLWPSEKVQRIKKENNQRASRTRRKLKREINSLNKDDLFASTFTTEVTSPDGSISSVKRSSRVKASVSKILECKLDNYEVANQVKQDLYPCFEMETKRRRGGNLRVRSKVKAEKI